MHRLLFQCNKLLLTELSRSVWENLDQGGEYRPTTVRSAHTTTGQDSPIQTDLGPLIRLIWQRGKL